MHEDEDEDDDFCHPWVCPVEQRLQEDSFIKGRQAVTANIPNANLGLVRNLSCTQVTSSRWEPYHHFSGEKTRDA